MKVFTIFAFILLAIILPVYAGGQSDDSMEKMESSEMMEKEMESPLTDFVNMDDAMMKAESHPTVLFFHAGWCPSCKAARKDFEANAADLEGINLVVVDYDSSVDLQKKYNVSYQHTFVQISPEGEAMTQWNGGKTKELLEKIVKTEM